MARGFVGIVNGFYIAINNGIVINAHIAFPIHCGNLMCISTQRSIKISNYNKYLI